MSADQDIESLISKTWNEGTYISKRTNSVNHWVFHAIHFDESEVSNFAIQVCQRYAENIKKKMGESEVRIALQSFSNLRSSLRKTSVDMTNLGRRKRNE